MLDDQTKYIAYVFGRTHVAPLVDSIASIIRWFPPPQGWFKLNCDGVRSEMHRRARLAVALLVTTVVDSVLHSLST